MSSRIARVNALEVAIRNDESSKLRRRGVLAAERAQRRDEPSALPRGRVGGSQAESHEFGLRLARDDVPKTRRWASRAGLGRHVVE